MELEFDKEINAILRKARDSGAAAGTAVASPHPDADSIAAFAENALPDKAKLLYMEHFADCDRCRKLLSQSVLMNSEADATAASSAVSPVAAVPAISWFERIFKLPNFALAMGTLVVLFAGGLGYLVIQNRNSASENAISKATEPRAAAPSRASDSLAESSNPSASNAMAAANTEPSNSSASAPITAANSASNASVRPGGPNTGLEKETTTDGAAVDSDKPAVAAAAPPPAAVEAQPKTEVAKKTTPEEKMKDDSRSGVTGGRDEASADRKVRELAVQANRNEGPSRASGQVQLQQENNVSNATSLANTPTKQAGGKRFNLRDGVWYDAAYHGQPTTNFRRGTDDYQKLDGNVRKIADSIGGTVVVVWKSRAYRIQ